METSLDLARAWLKQHLPARLDTHDRDLAALIDAVRAEPPCERWGVWRSRHGKGAWLTVEIPWAGTQAEAERKILDGFSDEEKAGYEARPLCTTCLGTREVDDGYGQGRKKGCPKCTTCVCHGWFGVVQPICSEFKSDCGSTTCATCVHSQRCHP
jgi:hypothetical protein